MKKEEILEKSRSENRDEREEIVRDKSMRWTLITMVVLSAAFAYIRGTKGESVMDLAVVVCGSTCVSFLYRFFKTKRKDYLVWGIVTACAAAFALVKFCMGY